MRIVGIFASPTGTDCPTEMFPGQNVTVVILKWEMDCTRICLAPDCRWAGYRQHCPAVPVQSKKCIANSTAVIASIELISKQWERGLQVQQNRCNVLLSSRTQHYCGDASKSNQAILQLHRAYRSMEYPWVPPGISGPQFKNCYCTSFKCCICLGRHRKTILSITTLCKNGWNLQ